MKSKECQVFGACGTYGGNEKLYKNLVRKLEETDHLRELGVDGRIILR
jgi:hypothetical protein